MALACPIPAHPVGADTFCRICGRDYVTVPDPVVAEAPTLPAPVDAPFEAPVLDPGSPSPPPAALPDPLPFGELHVPTAPAEPPPAHPVLDTALIDTRFAEMTAPEAPLGGLAAAAEPVSEPADAPAAKRTARPLPPAALHALAGGGAGAVLMALVDRFVL